MLSAATHSTHFRDHDVDSLVVCSLLITICNGSSAYGFRSFSSNRHILVTSSRRCREQYLKTDDNDDDNKEFLDPDNKTDNLDIDALLDTPIFDPEKSNSWFANLVRDDYNTAEALYAGLIIAAGVIASQEALRFVKYGGSGYIPFHGGGGKLF